MFSPVDYLKHILDETRFIIDTTSGINFEGLQENAMMQRALCRSLEIIGEATKNLSFPFRDRYPHLNGVPLQRQEIRLSIIILTLTLP